MDTITTLPPRTAAADTTILTSYFPVPLLGLVPINAFVLHAAEPVLVDTGMFRTQDDFMRELRSVVELARLRWIWLTHVDADHVGALDRVLAEAPEARVVTTFLGLGKQNLRSELSPDRVFLLNPGERLDVGDRKLLATRPPTYDAPETTAILDEKTGVLFSSDAFGAVLQDPIEEADALAPEDLRRGNILWATIDSPWLHAIDRAAFARALGAVRDLDPDVVLSSHLPPARRLLGRMIDHLEAAVTAPPFMGPNDATLRAAMGPMRTAT